MRYFNTGEPDEEDRSWHRHETINSSTTPAQSKSLIFSLLFTSDGKTSREIMLFGPASLGLQGPDRPGLFGLRSNPHL